MNIPVNFVEEEHVPTLSEAVSKTVSKPASALSKKSAKHSHRTSRFSVKDFFTTLLTATFVLLALTLVISKFLGFRAFTVMSGSMTPVLPVGSLIYVKPTDPATLKSGDIISFVANAEKTIVTHRIVSVVPDTTDPSILRFKTQGDANSTPDTNLVHSNNVLGTPLFAIPYLGYLTYYLQQPPGIYIALVLGTLLLAWAFLPATLITKRKEVHA